MQLLIEFIELNVFKLVQKTQSKVNDLFLNPFKDRNSLIMERAPISRFCWVTQKHTLQPVKPDFQTNYSNDLVLFSQLTPKWIISMSFKRIKKTYGAISVDQFPNEWL